MTKQEIIERMDNALTNYKVRSRDAHSLLSIFVTLVENFEGHLTQTSQEREREIVEALLQDIKFIHEGFRESIPCVTVKRIKDVAQKYNITLTNPNKD